jgi:hypothetical protein
MIASRRAHGAKQNQDLKELKAGKNEGNVRWLERAKADHGLILLGGTSLGHFRLRVAQSHVRGDFMPSFWSVAGIITRPGRLATVPLENIGEAAAVTRDNGVVEVPLKTFDDPERFPNIAALQFATAVDPGHLAAVRADRSIADLPTLMLKWLGYAWGTDQPGNPLLQGSGIPSAVFVESVYSLARIDLTPGLSTASSCPEAIWQSAKWWRKFYEGAVETQSSTAPAVVPRGSYTIRQEAAAVGVE